MKQPVIGQTVNLKKANPTKIIAVYDGVNMQGERAIYSVKTTSGDVYDVVQDGLNWQAVR